MGEVEGGKGREERERERRRERGKERGKERGRRECQSMAFNFPSMNFLPRRGSSWRRCARSRGRLASLVPSQRPAGGGRPACQRGSDRQSAVVVLPQSAQPVGSTCLDGWSQIPNSDILYDIIRYTVC